MKIFTPLLALSFALTVAAQDMPEMPKPGPQHKKLAQAAGTWDAAMEMHTPDGPMKSTGVSVCKVMLGGFWTIDDFTADVMGQPFRGHGMTGYDPIKGKYVSTWADSMSPSMMLMEGNYDQAGKVLTMTGMGTGPDGKPTPHRLVHTWKNKDTYHFEMFMTGPDGKEIKLVTIIYTRRADKTDAKPGR